MTALCAFAALFSASCANYKLAGTAQTLPFSTIFVKPAQNKSYATQVAPMLTSNVCKMLAATPDLELVGADDAQAQLEIEITDYKKDGVSTRPDDTAMALSFNQELTAKCSLFDRRSGKYIFKDKEVKYSLITYSETSGDVLGPQYQNMSNLARGLARRIVDETLGIW